MVKSFCCFFSFFFGGHDQIRSIIKSPANPESVTSRIFQSGLFPLQAALCLRAALGSRAALTGHCGKSWRGQTRGLRSNWEQAIKIGS